MAAPNNYFGFTPGGTQYSAQPATAYPTAQPAYVAQPATHQAAYAAAPRAAATYETYQTAPATSQYAYTTTRAQVPAATYDTTKTFYQPTAQPAYTVAAETHYQTAAKPVYSTNTSYQTVSRATTVHKTVPVASSASTYVYPSTTASSATPAATTYGATSTSYTSPTSYDAALYSAATSYYQSKQAPSSTTNFTKKPYIKTAKPKIPPKPPQLHYCDVCKISCAGPQTYREHLEGQKHKKKEAAAKAGTAQSSASRGQNQLKCELCDVACTGSDAYAAHIRGAKHQKVVKLHQKLGKPIPSSDPVVVVPAGSTAASATSATKAAATGTVKKVTATTAAPVVKKVTATPKITFVGGNKLNSLNKKEQEVAAQAAAAANAADKDDSPVLPGEKEVTPVGHEYIEEVKNETGKVVSFQCKLCECKFNDPNAKEMHLKGRRHRLQYKKKVDPSLQVETKPNIREFQKKFEAKMKAQHRMEEEYYWEERRRFEEMQWARGPGGPPFGPRGPGPMGMRRPDTADDRTVMAKHTAIYPNEQELQSVQNIVSSCEKALKMVSDHIAETDSAPKAVETPTPPAKKGKKGAKAKVVVKEEPEVKEEPKDEKDDEKKDDAPARALKGVMRVGVLAKGLLLHGDLNVHLVVLCSEKPTRTLLERIADNLPKQLMLANKENPKGADEVYDVRRCVEECAIIVSNDKEPKASCTITLTSPVMREGKADAETPTVKDPPDVLDRHKCLDALAALRHAKWFQARATGLQSCVIVIRILRDLCQRVPTWSPLNQWAMELLVEKCVSSSNGPLSPGDALRRVFECICSGILLPGGPGLYDPCEKEPTDAAGQLTNQEREDITASAQHALRLIAFRQIHKVLGMDPLPVPKFAKRNFNPRKRRRTTSGAEGDEAEEKKDKKDDDSVEDK
ncbi:unnamed protein product [Owenia fusiformis]|uniref:Uncharacterized protein n=1 Tax=Owenia fusiformis TaxID=6347 RepID=A0A8J1TZK8_OWEFU|nr:unnamed protein product [Owenia fusiformis]